VIDNHPPADEPRFDLLDQLERRHEEVLLQIDDLASRIEATLLRFKPSPQAEEIVAKVIVANSDPDNS
jgi:hypothetical protein